MFVTWGFGVLQCLMTPDHPKGIMCLQIARSNTRLHVTWAVVLVGCQLNIPGVCAWICICNMKIR